MSQQIIDYCKQLSQMKNSWADARMESFRFRGLEPLLVEFGQHFDAPTEECNNALLRSALCFSREPKECFRNAAVLANSRQGLYYVEGIALGILPVHHAWCINEAWEVLDPTWTPPGTEYFGIPLTHTFLNGVVAMREIWGVLDMNMEVFRNGLPSSALAFPKRIIWAGANEPEDQPMRTWTSTGR